MKLQRLLASLLAAAAFGAIALSPASAQDRAGADLASVLGRPVPAAFDAMGHALNAADAGEVCRSSCGITLERCKRACGSGYGDCHSSCSKEYGYCLKGC